MDVYVPLAYLQFPATVDYRPFGAFSFLQPVLPIFAVISLLWAAWDPTYASFLKAQQQSRQVRIQGKYAYNVSRIMTLSLHLLKSVKALQILSWTCRLICSSVLSLHWFRPGHGSILRLYDSITFFLTMFLIELLVCPYLLCIPSCCNSDLSTPSRTYAQLSFFEYTSHPPFALLTSIHIIISTNLDRVLLSPRQLRPSPHRHRQA